eukprot:TRINITY_DN52718_c0_g1_i1.p1 TRINITY_DN52718_c0_g1~~TRINITY_DN52718_c0_g1_i1.p1  ORF type:complete len:108 (+),score=19.07 TRINITY_DN52718_c0_g1_i1:24-326(+)
MVAGNNSWIAGPLVFFVPPSTLLFFGGLAMSVAGPEVTARVCPGLVKRVYGKARLGSVEAAISSIRNSIRSSRKSSPSSGPEVPHEPASTSKEEDEKDDQ